MDHVEHNPLLANAENAWLTCPDQAIHEVLKQHNCNLVSPPIAALTDIVHGRSELGLCTDSSSSEDSLSKALSILTTLAERAMVPALVRLVHAGQLNTPLPFVSASAESCTEQGALWGAQRGELSRLVGRRIVRDEYKFVWVSPHLRRQDYRVERHIWLADAGISKPSSVPTGLSVSQFVDIPLGDRFSKKRSCLPLGVPHIERHLSDEITALCWSNTTVIAQREIIVCKDYVVRSM
jgi:hypothetical protein